MKKERETMQNPFGFVRVAAATPAVRVADPAGNVRAIETCIREAAANGAAVIAFPELAVTGYTCGDLFKDRALMAAAEKSLFDLIDRTKKLDILCAVGMPVPSGGALEGQASRPAREAEHPGLFGILRGPALFPCARGRRAALSRGGVPREGRAL